MSRDRLASLLWGSSGEEQARNSLRQALFILRRVLQAAPSPALLVDPRSVSLDASAVEVDAIGFERLVAAGTEESLARAVALYRGDLLEGIGVKEAGFEDWLLGEQGRLRDLALKALERLLALHTAASNPERAVHVSRRLLALDPLHEDVHRTLMRLYMKQGRWGAALRQYELCRAAVRRQVGVEPEAETRRLYQEILRDRALGTAPEDDLEPRVPRRRTSRPAPLRLLRPAPDTPLVGRQSEVAHLREALDEVWQGRGQVVGIVGQVGIGKSRLVEHIAADAEQRGGRVLIGRSYETEQTLPFRPWIDALRAKELLGDPDLLGDLNPVWRRELTRLFPELGPSDAGRPPDVQDHPRLFEAVTHLVQLLERRQPLVVVIEDAHWADELSLRLLGFLAHRIPEWRVLAVATARSEELSDSPVLRQLLSELSRDRRLVHLPLGALSRQETRALVRTLAEPGQDADRLEEQVWRTSAGNPFMAVESLRALREGTLRQGPHGLPLPERVREVVLRRFERLGEPARHLVGVAAVIAREFDLALVRRVTGLPEEELSAAVEELLQREVLHGVERGFDFSHERLREVAYADLGAPRRVQLHRRVLEALEDVHRDDRGPVHATLAFHARQAELWERTLEYSRLAGARAFLYGGHREATGDFDQALDALRNLPETRERLEQAVDLRCDLRHALLPLAEADRISQVLDEARSLSERLGDQARLGKTLAFLANHHWWVGEYDRALEAAHEALQIARAIGDPTLEVSTIYYEGLVHHGRGDYRRAVELLQRTRASLEGGLTSTRFGIAHFTSVVSATWLSWALTELGEIPEAEASAADAVRIAGAGHQPFLLAHAYAACGHVALRKGDVERAIGWFERLREIERAGALRVLFPLAEWFLVNAYAAAGRPEAVPLLAQVASAPLSERSIFYYPLWLAWLAEGHLRAGRTEDAAVLAERALTLARRRGERGHVAWILRLSGEIASESATDRAERAEGYFLEALGLATTLRMRVLRASCDLGLGRLYRRLGNAAANEHMQAATTLAGELGIRLGLTDRERAR